MPRTLFTLLLTALLLAACGGSEPQPSPTPTLAPGELIHISGQGPFTSQPFTIEAPPGETVIVQVNWTQQTSGAFSLEISSDDPDKADTPEAQMTFDYATGPSEGSSLFDYTAGTYQVEIGETDGPWTVWVRLVSEEELPGLLLP